MERWLPGLSTAAPDVVAAWSGIEDGRLPSVRREVRRRTGAGAVERIVPQLAGVHDPMHLDQVRAISATFGAAR